MVYYYSRLQGQSDQSTSVYPVMPVFLVYKHQFIKTPLFGLVDSGAEYCYCHKIIGEYLRVKFNKKNKVSSRAANGTEFMGYKERVTTIISGKRIEVPMIFSDELNHNFQIVLGQNGFFSSFEICFNKSANEFSVT